MSGRGEVMRAADGRGVRMGQRWHSVRVCSAPLASVTLATASLTVYAPFSAVQVTVHSPSSGLSRQRWVTAGVSGQVA